MTKRVMPAPDRYASCPYEGSVLDYYRECFESAFVFLHPFVRPISIDSAYDVLGWPFQLRVLRAGEVGGTGGRWWVRRVLL